MRLSKMKEPADCLVQSNQRLCRALEPYFNTIDIPALLTRLDKDRTGFENVNVWRYFQAYKQVLTLTPSTCLLRQARLQIGGHHDITETQKETLIKALKLLMPWRKGPLSFFGVDVDTEWQSNLKWDRLYPHLPDLYQKRVLDVGCNSGYYLCRLAAEKSAFVLGIDPYPLYFFQNQVIQHFCRQEAVHFGLLGLEDLGPFKRFFDVSLCMGILYHHREPFTVLKRLKQATRPKGMVVIETLIIEEDSPLSLTPKGRYAGMPNVYYIPSLSCLENWLEKAGYHDMTVCSVTRTTPDEQCETPWAEGFDFKATLSSCGEKTIEGYPAPVRAIVTAVV